MQFILEYQKGKRRPLIYSFSIRQLIWEYIGLKKIQGPQAIVWPPHYLRSLNVWGGIINMIIFIYIYTYSNIQIYFIIYTVITVEIPNHL